MCKSNEEFSAKKKYARFGIMAGSNFQVPVGLGHSTRQCNAGCEKKYAWTWRYPHYDGTGLRLYGCHHYKTVSSVLSLGHKTWVHFMSEGSQLRTTKKLINHIGCTWVRGGFHLKDTTNTAS